MQIVTGPSGTGQQVPDDRDIVVDSANNLLDIWGDLAGSEALTRALVAERTENREMAKRWAQVYFACVNRK